VALEYKVGDTVKIKNTVGVIDLRLGEVCVVDAVDTSDSTYFPYRLVSFTRNAAEWVPISSIGPVEDSAVPAKFTFAIPHTDVESEASIEASASEVDYVNAPPHYMLIEDFEVKDLMKLLLDRIETSSVVHFSHFQSSCYKEAVQYLVRCMNKNGIEDIRKAQYYINEVLKLEDSKVGA
jgi:hypothetical protein